MFKNILIKIFGKKLDTVLEKHGVSKTKVTAVVGALVVGYGYAAPAFGLPPVPQGTLEVLAAFGLWSLRDGVDAKR